jgi:hypothetical protein
VGRTQTGGYRSAWQTEVAVRIDELAHRLEVAGGAGQPSAPRPPQERAVRLETATAELSAQIKETPREGGLPANQRNAHIGAVVAALASAKQSLDDAERAAGPRRRFRAWWSGTIVTAAWESVHEAEAELVEIESDDAVRASLTRLLAWIRAAMPSSEQRKRYERQLTEFMSGDKRVDRTVVRQAYSDVIAANNEKHVNLRVFRNQLLTVTVVLGMLLAGLAIWHAANPSFISLCGTIERQSKSMTTTPAPATKRRRTAKRAIAAHRVAKRKRPRTHVTTSIRTITVPTCLSGPKPRGIDLLVVELVGALGGLLSIAIALGGIAAPPSRYDTRWLQAFLKPVAGGATALIGVLILQAGILIQPAGAPISESLLLAYAALFGFSQQLFTRYVDKHGAKLLDE